MEDNNTVETVESTPSETGAEETTETRTASDADLDLFSKTLNGEEVDTETKTEETEEIEVQDLREEKDEPAEENKEEVPAQTFTLKHNGAEFQVTQEQIVPLAQKGMDYDRIREQRDNLLNDPSLRRLDDFARLQGMSREQFIGSLVEAFEGQQISMMAGQLMEQRGLDEQTAYEMASLHYQNENAQKYQEYQRAEQERAYQEELYNAQVAESEEAKTIQSFNALINKYPELKDKRWDEFPEQVRNDITNGISPLEAYQSFVIAERSKELEILKTNNKNKERATGDAKHKSTSEDSDFDIFKQTLFAR